MTTAQGLAVLLFFAVACSPDDSAPDASEQVPVDAFGFGSLEEAREHLGEYADIFVPTDGSLSLRATQYAAADDRRTDYALDAFYRDPIRGVPVDGGTYRVGEFFLDYVEGEGGYVRRSAPADDPLDSDLSPLFGSSQEVAIERTPGVSLASAEIYVPAQLRAELGSSEIVEGTTATAISRAGANLTFQLDDANEHGVVVYALWTGSRVGVAAQETDNTVRVQSAILVPESGTVALPESLFRDIPEGAVFSLFVIRGDVELLEADNLTFRFASIEETKLVVSLTD